MFCSQPQSTPLPMKLLNRHRALTLLVRSKAGSGMPPGVVHEKTLGACGGDVTDSPRDTISELGRLIMRPKLTIEDSGTCKQSMISSRENGSQDDSVHERCRDP